MLEVELPYRIADQGHEQRLTTACSGNLQHLARGQRQQPGDHPHFAPVVDLRFLGEE